MLNQNLIQLQVEGSHTWEGDPIQLISSGTVSAIKRDPSGNAGRSIYVDHPDGTQTRYFHGSGFPADIEVGQNLQAGTTIMYAGSTGRSTGPHLHFEVGRMEGGEFKQMNPEKVYPEVFGGMRHKHGPKKDDDVLKNNMNI